MQATTHSFSNSRLWFLPTITLKYLTGNKVLFLENVSNKFTWGITGGGHQGVHPWRGKGIVERGRGIFFHHGVLLYYSLPWSWAGQQPVVCAVFTRRHLWGKERVTEGHQYKTGSITTFGLLPSLMNKLNQIFLSSNTLKSTNIVTCTISMSCDDFHSSVTRPLAKLSLLLARCQAFDFREGCALQFMDSIIIFNYFLSCESLGKINKISYRQILLFL